MGELVTNTPIRKAGMGPESIGKVMPIVSSVALGEIMPSLEVGLCWNVSSDHGERVEAADELLDRFLLTEGIDAVATNLDSPFQTWTGRVLNDALDAGSLLVAEEEVFSCRDCEAPQALSESPVLPDDCSGCGEVLSTAVMNQTVMTMKLPQDPSSLSENVNLSFTPNNWRGQVLTLPERVLVSKRRRSGVSLREFGMDLMLDERLVNVAMPLYLAAKADAERSWSVLDSSHLNKVAPFGYAFRGLDLPDIGVMGISRMPLKEVLASEDLLSRLEEPNISRVVSLIALHNGSWMDNPHRLGELMKHARRAANHYDETGSIFGEARLPHKDVRSLAVAASTSLLTK